MGARQRICGIYRITCTTHGRCYIGSSANVHKRWERHRDDLRRGVHHSIALQRAWKKHGRDAFTWEIIEEVEDPAALAERECYYLDRDRPFYNQLGIREGMAGLKHNEETRARMSEGQARHWEKRRIAGDVTYSPEHRAAISAGRKGQHPTEEARKNMSEAARVRGMAHLQSEEVVARRSAALKGRPKSETARAALRAGQARALAGGTHASQKRSRESYLRKDHPDRQRPFEEPPADLTPPEAMERLLRSV